MKNLHAYIRKGKFYEAVVEQGSDIIFIVDFSGKIYYHNASVKSLGYRAGTLIGKNIFDFISPETLDSFQRQFRQSQRKAFNQKIEFQFRCRDKSYRFFEFNSINLKHRGGPEGLILDCRDITQRKEDAAELLRLQKTKEQFMANISHEIRTPINGIAGMIDLLSQNPPEEDRKAYLNAIRHSAENLKVIINDLLDLSAIESGKLKFEKIPFNAAELIQNLAQTFTYQVREKRLEFNVQIAPEVNRMIIGDPARLNQIITNLVSNAVKFTHRGSITVTANILRANTRKCVLKVSVKDTGVGIPADKLQTIFESFSQADASVTRRYGGTGLGLAIARQLAELQKGTITVQSTVHVGSEFIVSIPYLCSEKTRIALPHTTLKLQQPAPGLRVLLVEDNEINRLYAETLLKSWSCITDTADNGLMAVEKIKSGEYDAVLMDVQMPVMDGYESTQTIRQLPGKSGSVPIIALTANATKADLEKCMAAGMNAYLPKPFTREDLYRVLFVELKLTPSQPGNLAAGAPEVTFSLEYLHKISNHDQEFVKDIVSTFVRTSASLLVELENYIQHAKWPEAGRLIHQIKPSLSLLGMHKLKEKASVLELSCKSNHAPPGLHEELRSFTKLLRDATLKLKKEVI